MSSLVTSGENSDMYLHYLRTIYILSTHYLHTIYTLSIIYRAVVTVAVSASTLSTTQPGVEHESLLSPPHRLLLGQARPYRTHHQPT